jgi:predicted GIY-YIG superfamily endonuclease
MLGDDQNPIYIGKSMNVKSRLAAHRRDRQRHDVLNGRTKWPLTAEQRTKLAELLTPVRISRNGGGGDAAT